MQVPLPNTLAPTPVCNESVISSSSGGSSTSTDRRVDDGLMQCSYCHSDSVEVMAILSETNAYSSINNLP